MIEKPSAPTVEPPAPAAPETPLAAPRRVPSEAMRDRVGRRPDPGAAQREQDLREGFGTPAEAHIKTEIMRLQRLQIDPNATYEEKQDDEQRLLALYRASMPNGRDPVLTLGGMTDDDRALWAAAEEKAQYARDYLPADHQ